MKDKLAFVGCGLIGAGLAANSLLTGHPTALYDTCDTAIIKERITAILNTFVTHGAYTQEQADEAAASFTAPFRRLAAGMWLSAAPLPTS